MGTPMILLCLISEPIEDSHVVNENIKTDQSDEELIAAARDGDDEAFRQLVSKHQSRVAATVIGMLGQCPEADDVGQETFIRFYNALGHFRGESGVETYLTRIAINLSLNELKRRKRRNWLFLPALGRKEETFEARAPRIELTEEAELLHQAIQKLSPEFRSVVVLRMFEERSTEETAALLGISEGTVKSRLARAHHKLKKLLQPYWGE